MAYGSYRRRRLGFGRVGFQPGGSYLTGFSSLDPVPFKRKRKYSGVSSSSASKRLGRRVRRRVTRKFVARRRPKRAVIRHGENSSASNTYLGRAFLPGAFRAVAAMSGKKVISATGTTPVSSLSQEQGIGLFPYLNLVDLNDIRVEANGGVDTTATVSYVLRQVKSVVAFKNQSNVPCKVKIFDLVCKRDTVGTTRDNPLEAWTAGLSDIASLMTPKSPGAIPFRSAEFNRYWACRRMITHDLEPGEQHTHTVYHRFNRVIKDVDIGQRSPQTVAYYSGFTMIVVLGSLGHDTTTATKIGFMPILLDCAHRRTQPRPTYLT